MNAWGIRFGDVIKMKCITCAQPGLVVSREIIREQIEKSRKPFAFNIKQALLVLFLKVEPWKTKSIQSATTGCGNIFHTMQFPL